MPDNLEVENDGLEPVTWLNFCERAYRAANADIDEAIKSGSLESGRAHFQRHRDGLVLDCGAGSRPTLASSTTVLAKKK
ncbi:hypothetical protein [Paraburkholderia sediminicola]|uniref:hypothetical protein n=1 Tax=Paraburkholderia sediminicola TaxID=458836 RepID=UPI0038BD7537